MFVPACFRHSADGFVLAALAVVTFGAATVLSPSLAAQVVPESYPGAVGQMAPRHVPPPTPEVAAGAGPVAGCYHCYNMEQHHFASALYPFSDWGPGDGPHFYRARSGLCLYVHGVCIYSPGQVAATPRDLTNAIADAAARQDVVTLADLLITSPAHVFAERSAIQVLACDGETIAGHVPVQRNLLQSIQAAVAEIDSDR